MFWQLVAFGHLKSAGYHYPECCAGCAFRLFCVGFVLARKYTVVDVEPGTWMVLWGVVPNIGAELARNIGCGPLDCRFSGSQDLILCYNWFGSWKNDNSESRRS